MQQLVTLEQLLAKLEGYEVNGLHYSEEFENWYVTTTPNYEERACNNQFDSLDKDDEGNVMLRFDMSENSYWTPFFEKHLEGFINVETATIRQLDLIADHEHEWDFAGPLMVMDGHWIIRPVGMEWYEYLTSIKETCQIQFANLRSRMYSRLRPFLEDNRACDTYVLQNTDIKLWLLRNIGTEHPPIRHDGKLLLGEVATGDSTPTGFYSERELLILLTELGFN